MKASCMRVGPGVHNFIGVGTRKPHERNLLRSFGLLLLFADCDCDSPKTQGRAALNHIFLFHIKNVDLPPSLTYYSIFTNSKDKNLISSATFDVHWCSGNGKGSRHAALSDIPGGAKQPSVLQPATYI